MKTIQELNPSNDDLLKFKHNYQPLLTTKLDNINTDFDQEVINEIDSKSEIMLIYLFK